MADAAECAGKTRRRWFRLTPDRVVLCSWPWKVFCSCPSGSSGSPSIGTRATHARRRGRRGRALLVMFLWFLAALVFRLRFQFSIRSLLLLVVVVAVPCGWLETEMKQAKKQREAVEEMRNAGGEVSYDYQLDPDGIEIPGAKPSEPAWLRRMLGDDLFVNVKNVNIDKTAIGDAGLEHLTTLTQLQTLWLRDPQVTDAGLEHLKELSHLERLSLAGWFSNAGLKHLEGLTQLQTLARRHQGRRRGAGTPQGANPAPNVVPPLD